MRSLQFAVLFVLGAALLACGKDESTAGRDVSAPRQPSPTRGAVTSTAEVVPQPSPSPAPSPTTAETLGTTPSVEPTTAVPPTRPQASQPTPAPPTPTPPLLLPTSVQINVGGQANLFVPANVTIAAGGTVTWTWVGGFHDLTGINFPLKVEVLNSGTKSFTFPTAGTFRFRCEIHPDTMNGIVTVG